MPSTVRILVVEDDPDIADSIQLILKTRGYDVSLAANGQEALDRLAEGLPSVIVLDMLMPIMNGWQFASELARRYPHGRPPIIVVTAAEHARSRADEIGAEAYVKKPFEARTLLAAVADVLARMARGSEP